jgi:thiosulfate/3-mercaptopyruvate sulfurtransferase
VKSYETLISPSELSGHLGDPDWAIFDMRASTPPDSGGKAKYLAGHIPGAVHAHLEQELSGPIIPGRTGRHPLPDPAEFLKRLSGWGIDDPVQVVVYDEGPGQNAARLWWMLRWLGHNRVAVLEGGWAAWEDFSGPVKTGDETRPPRRFTPRLRKDRSVDVGMVDKLRNDPSWCLIDARAADRFRGQNEKIDPIAGHIPGAVSGPWSENVDSDGNFRAREELARKYGSIVGDTPMDQVVVYCGSGVTAAHDILAMVHAGLGEPKLYVGSWSEWITDPSRPIATS